MKPDFSRFIHGLLMIGLLVALSSRCTNFQWDPLTERLNDNFSGALTNPGNVTTSGPNFSFVMTGDTHIGSVGGEVMKRVTQTAKAAGDLFMVVAGDITDTGELGQYRQFKAVMNDSSMTYRVAIGNHDIFFGGWSNFRSEMGTSSYTFDAGTVHFIMVDTANGTIGRRQLQWIENDLRTSSQPIKIIVTHFPPWDGYFSTIYKLSSEEEGAILKDLCYRYAVNYVLSGHYHGYNEADIGRTKYIVSGGSNDIMDPGQAQHFMRFSVTGSTISAARVPLN